MLPRSSKYYYILKIKKCQVILLDFKNFVISHKENPRRLAGAGWKEDEILMDGTNEIQRLSGTAQIMREMMENIILNQQASMYGMADALKDVSSCAANALSTGISDSIQMTSNISGALIDSMIQSLLAIAKEFQNVDYAAIAEETLETFKELEPFVPEKEKEKFKEIVEPPKEKKRKILTAENIKFLVGLIIPMLFSLYMYNLQNKTDEEQLRLKRESNAIEERKAEALEAISSGEAFKQFFDYLKDNGLVLTEAGENFSDKDIDTVDGSEQGSDGIVDRGNLIKQGDIPTK